MPSNVRRHSTSSPDRGHRLYRWWLFCAHAGREDLEDSAEAGRRDIDRLRVSVDDTLVGITASGRTPYVLGAVAAARERVRSSLAWRAIAGIRRYTTQVDIMIAPNVGPEVVAGSTRLKAGTAQKMVLNMLSTGDYGAAGQDLWQPDGGCAGHESETP